MDIGMYGGFPPPICGQTLSNKVLFDFLKKKGYKINRYNTAVDFNQVGKFNFKKIIHGLGLFYNFYTDIEKTDVLYSTMSQSKLGFLKFYPMFKLCQFKNIPYIIHLHGNMLPKTFNQGSNLIKRLIIDVLDNSKKIIVLSELLKQQEPYQLSSTKVEIVRNFVESEYFISYEQKKKIINENNKFKLFYLSNLMESKGILDVLKAALLLKKKGINFKLHIAGLWQDKIRDKGEKIINQLGEEYVDYLGFVSGEEKKKLLQNSHVFLLPTYYPQEGQPISILEAMASGNIILTTRHSGIPDIVKEDNNGFFVKKKNPELIAEKIKMICSNKEIIKEIAKNNIEEAQEKYTVKRFATEIENIITE